jgi:hypothetical protein
MDGGPRQPEVEPSAPASAVAPALDYAPADRRRRRRRRVRRVAFVAVACVLLFAGWHWGPGAAHRAMVLYWQRQCLNYEAPAGAVVYETDPQVTPRLLGRGYGNVVRRTKNNADSLPNAAGYIPQCWRHFVNEVGWTNLPRRQSEHATAFCHQLISPAGHSRLVYVRFGDEPDSDHPDERALWFEGAVIVPGDWQTRPVGTWQDLGGIGINDQHFRYEVLPGRRDANDASWFIFDVHTSQGRGMRLGVQLTDKDSMRSRVSTEDWPPKP